MTIPITRPQVISGPGPNALHIENSIASAELQGGFKSDCLLPITISNAVDKNGDYLLASTAPGTHAVNGIPVIQWATSATAAEFARWPFAMPGEWAETLFGFDVFVLVRKVDATDENANLAMIADLSWFEGNPQGTASEATLTTLTAVQSEALSTSAAASDLSGFEWHHLDLGAAMLAQAKEPSGLDACYLDIAPHETVGSSDMVLQMAQILVRVRRHTALRNKSWR